MAHFKFRNINDAFRGLVEGIHSGRIPTNVVASRYGECSQVEEPVIVTYERPLERVLFNTARDCNPFMHLYEALWMLAGREDVAPLVYYTKRFAEFSDDGMTFNGAYGYRWRHADTSAMERDQLEIIVEHLRDKPESRRAVLQMWNVEDDLLKINESRDVCCNTCVYFAVRQGVCTKCKGTGRGSKTQGSFPSPEAGYACPKCQGHPHDQPQFLDMTVCNRSNDLVWGMLGANAVHMSVLAEYVAAHLGLEVGVYNQVTNNLHCYHKTWEPEKWLAEYQIDYKGGQLEYPKPFPLVRDPAVFDEEVGPFVERNSGAGPYSPCSWQEPFLNDVAQPMCTAFRAYKEKWGGGWQMWVNQIKAEDWRRAALGWLERRAAKHEAKQRVQVREDDGEY